MAFSAILKIYTASLGAAFKTHPPDPKRTLCSCNRCSVKTKHLNACFLTAGSFGVEEPSLRLTNCVQKRCRLEQVRSRKAEMPRGAALHLLRAVSEQLAICIEV